jgi:hypothetical protein
LNLVLALLVLAVPVRSALLLQETCATIVVVGMVNQNRAYCIWAFAPSSCQHPRGTRALGIALFSMRKSLALCEPASHSYAAWADSRHRCWPASARRGLRPDSRGSGLGPRVPGDRSRAEVQRWNDLIEFPNEHQVEPRRWETKRSCNEEPTSSPASPP